MNGLRESIYVVGPEATGVSSVGREKEISDLESIFFSSAAIHLVGPTRIGKSSLVSFVFDKNQDYQERICVKMSMGECQDAYDFWKTLSVKIEDQLYEKELWNKQFERLFNQLRVVTGSSPDWFSDFKLSIQNILKQIKKIGYRLVLAIDEFDSVVKVFAQASHYFQTLRSIYSSPDYATSGVIISRRRLHLLEAECKDISTFHGVFREKSLLPFSDEDMKEFYESLEMYDIKLSLGGCRKLENYTGRMPYICCMFADRMVANEFTQSEGRTSIGDKEITAVFKECLPQIDRHYENLVDRLEHDNHLETVFYLSVSSKFPSYVTSRDIENLTTMGVLIPEIKNDSVKYCAYSKDFMTYFKLRPLKLPSWDTMTQSEKKLKAIFKKEYPKLDEVTYDELLDDSTNQIITGLNSEYPELKLNSGKIKRYCEDLAAHKEHPTILDVLTLSEVVKIILDTWSARFHKYFSGDESWKPKLSFIMELRNPMAHAAVEYINQEDLAVCMKYCDEIIHMKY